MKVVILTSSIFYLLGLKMSQNIETSSKTKPAADAVQVKQEQTIGGQQTTEQKEAERTLFVQPQKTVEISEPDSDANNPVIHQRTNHLLEKMD
jgi:hypothetical protein